MTYQWKTPYLMPVDAQTAGAELSRICQKNGTLEPSDVVEESRPETAPLHPCFEWNDIIAAEKYREYQAGGIIRNIVVVEEKPDKPDRIRAFVHVQSTYQPIQVVLSDEEKRMEMLQNALRELRAFTEKYKSLKSLEPVFEAIEKISA